MRASPYHQWLGVELVREQAGEVEVYLPYRDEFAGSADRTNIHGGIISTLADIAACFAMMSSTGYDTPNLDLRVDYLRMARAGTDLVAVAKTVKAGRTIGVADVEIRTPEGRVIAVGRSTLVTSALKRDTLTGNQGDS
jgi:uncharacterized protein (TIGR00369 family)